MRICISGWRKLNNYELVRDTIEAQLPPATEDMATWVAPPGLVIIHGDAAGADRLADEWAIIRGVGRGVGVEVYPADWTGLGRKAGAIRNQQMVDEGKPDLVLAFPRLGVSVGTYDLIRRAKKAGIKTIIVEVDGFSNPVAKQSPQP